MFCMVIIVESSVLKFKFAKIVELKCFHQKNKIQEKISKAKFIIIAGYSNITLTIKERTG